jgi:hypothetical protein
MNTGMQDMINLSWKLAMVMKGQAKPELLDTYNSDRVPIIHNVLNKTEALTHAIGTENTLFRSVFNPIAPWLVSMENVQQKSTERMSQLALNYRGSPLSDSTENGGDLRAGDRVSDLPVTALNRQAPAERSEPATIFGLLDPSSFTLFFSNISDPAKTHSEVQNAIGPWHNLIRGHAIAALPDEGTFQKHFGSSPSIVLVRPDGYVAFTGTDKSVAKLASYCEKWLISPPSSARKEVAHE